MAHIPTRAVLVQRGEMGSEVILLDHGGSLDLTAYTLNAFLQAQRLEEDLDEWYGGFEWSTIGGEDALKAYAQDKTNGFAILAYLNAELDLVTLDHALLREVKRYYGLQ